MKKAHSTTLEYDDFGLNQDGYSLDVNGALSSNPPDRAKDIVAAFRKPERTCIYRYNSYPLRRTLQEKLRF